MPASRSKSPTPTSSTPSKAGRSKSPMRPTQASTSSPSKSPTKSPSKAVRSKSPRPTQVASTSPKKTRSRSPVPNTSRAISPTRMNGMNPHEDDATFEQAVRRCIPSTFNLIAGQDDLSQAQEAYKATKLFQLPNAIGEEGGLATSALLQFLYEHVEETVVGNATPPRGITCRQVMKEVHSRMNQAKKSDIVPQMSSSRPLGPPRLETHAPFYLVPPGYTGKRRALLIGCNFTGQPGELRAPHNDVHNALQFLMNKCGFKEEDIMVLKDDGKSISPTKKNIEDGFAKMVASSKANDVLFIQYSGHGGRMKDTSGDEMDGYDSYILPVDHATAGQILDDDILKCLIKALPEGVHSTMLVDCCHSGTYVLSYI